MDFDHVYPTRCRDTVREALGQFRRHRVVNAVGAIINKHNQTKVGVGRLAGNCTGTGHGRIDSA